MNILHESLQRRWSQDSLINQITVLQLLAQPLQGGQRLVQRDRHRDLAQVLPDVLAQQVPQVHTLRLSLGDRQLAPRIFNDVWNQHQFPRVSITNHKFI